MVRVRQEEELEHLRDELEQQKDDEERAVDKGLMERELEEAKKQAGVARSTVEVTLKLALSCNVTYPVLVSARSC